MYDVFEKSFDPAFALIERTEDLCAVELDAQPASVATGAQALSAPRRVRARRSATRRSRSNWRNESKLFNNLSIAEGAHLEAIGIAHPSHYEIHRHIEAFSMCVYFRTSNIWEAACGKRTSRGTMRRCLREGVEFFRFLPGHAA
ncbi:hypothetical protein [Paraburkholderia aromaticivorans]|uniref:hypothetical protein n=1 Tax=Paraburkholderia aromaticivorans TaxID=2026199 RepID=UPI001980362E|nr:hypothetical protein [Paraburkholderia aromaticivorans]